MWWRLFVGLLLVSSIPVGTYTTVYAAEKSVPIGCTTIGSTVVYINGVLTTEEEAKLERDKVREKFLKYNGSKYNTIFKLAYNPSHLAGMGDMIKSAEQAYTGAKDKSIDDFDLQTILSNLHTNITTQKILLVGHSQGTFYTNAVYQYLTTHGIPKSAIAIYNIATPASFVAGNGDYITSSTDSVIQAVRDAAQRGRAYAPLPPNVTFTLTKKEKAFPWSGHALSAVYLKYADYRIAKAMTTDIQSLVSQNIPKSVTSGCFTAPHQGVPYTAQKIAFNIFDPTATFTKNVVGGATHTVLLSKRAVVTGVEGVWGWFKKKPPLPIPAKNKEPVLRDILFTGPVKVYDKIQNIVPKEAVTRHARYPLSSVLDLSAMQHTLDRVRALLVPLQKQITTLHNTREATCIANSLHGPWDKVGWTGDKPGCDDPTPGVQKMFWAPIQGAGGEAATVAITGTISGNPQSGFSGSTHIVWSTSGATQCTVSGSGSGGGGGMILGPPPGGGDTWNGLSGNQLTAGTLIGSIVYTLSCDSGTFTKTTTVVGAAPVFQ